MTEKSIVADVKSAVFLCCQLGGSKALSTFTLKIRRQGRNLVHLLTNAKKGRPSEGGLFVLSLEMHHFRGCTALGMTARRHLHIDPSRCRDNGKDGGRLVAVFSVSWHCESNSHIFH